MSTEEPSVTITRAATELSRAAAAAMPEQIEALYDALVDRFGSKRTYRILADALSETAVDFVFEALDAGIHPRDINPHDVALVAIASIVSEHADPRDIEAPEN